MSLRIESVGALATVQDAGRFGLQHYGHATGGPMDEHAFLWANKLLDNPPFVAQIEMTLGQFRCSFTRNTSIAICGAEMQATLNGEAIRNWHSHAVEAGDVLSFGFARSGLRAYLAVAGGFDLPMFHHSCACVVREVVGGLDGRALQAGDELRYAAATTALDNRLVPDYFIPAYADDLDLGVIASAQFEDFDPEQRERFFDSAYTVTQDQDRMGIRLQGPPVIWNGGELLSEGIACGAIQIPGDGQPIVLAKDRQTVGGYPRLGCVSRLDLSRLAQARPGCRVQFYQQDFAEACALLQERQHFFRSRVI